MRKSDFVANKQLPSLIIAIIIDGLRAQDRKICAEFILAHILYGKSCISSYTWIVRTP